MTFIDDSELRGLATDLNAATVEMAARTRGVLQETGRSLRDRWRSNARESAGAHGKHYPTSITYETAIDTSGVFVEVGPDASLPQGGMSFEFGSINQPPHLDGQRATDSEIPLFERRVSLSVEDLL